MADNFNISDVPESAGPKSVEVPGDIADGTAGELMTWDAAGVASLVPTGTATDVLTSNGAGAAPTFQPGGGGGAVTSVFGRVGVVVAVAGDYDFTEISGIITDVQHGTRGGGTLHDAVIAAGASGFMTGGDKSKLDGIEAGAEVNDVFSVFGRVGTVVAASGDYSFLQLSDTPASYAGAGGQFVKVNAGATALEFVAGGGGGGFTEAASANNTGDTLISNSTNTVMPFNAESFDTDAMHDNAVNNSRLTINTAGTYIFGFDGRWENDGAGFRRIQLRKNGTTVVGEQHTQNVGGATEMFQCVTFPIQEAIVTDFFEILVFQNSGGALDMEAAAPNPTFWTHRLS